MTVLPVGLCLDQKEKNSRRDNQIPLAPNCPYSLRYCIPPQGASLPYQVLQRALRELKEVESERELGITLLVRDDTVCKLWGGVPGDVLEWGRISLSLKAHNMGAWVWSWVWSMAHTP